MTKKACNNLFKFTFVFVVCFFAILKASYASIASPSIASRSNLDKTLSISEMEEISDFEDLKEMIKQVFDFKDNKGTADLSDPINLMYSLVYQIFKTYDEKYVNSTLYHLLVGLAIIFLITNFSMKCYEESSAGNELKLDSGLMIKKYIQFIFALLMIFNLKSIVYFILSFFLFILKMAMNVTNANFIGMPDSIDNVIDADRVAYEILKENGIVNKNTLLDEVIVRSKESAVRTQFMIPWICSWISKLALVVVIFMNSIKLLVHSIFYMVAVGDFFGNIKNSKFIEYTKVLISLGLEETVIIIILYVSNLLLNPYLKDLLNEGVQNNGLSFLTLAMIFTGVQMSKVLVIISSSQIAKRIMGVA